MMEHPRIGAIEYHDGQLVVFHECGEEVFRGKVHLKAEFGFDGRSTMRFSFLPAEVFVRSATMEDDG